MKNGLKRIILSDNLDKIRDEGMWIRFDNIPSDWIGKRVRIVAEVFEAAKQVEGEAR